MSDSAEIAALIEKPPRASAPLSRRYAAPAYRVASIHPPTWSKVTPARDAFCHECAQVQHESQGAFGPRMRPRARRKLPGEDARSEHTLLLCGPHATVWKDRDAADMAVQTAKAAGR